MKTESPEISDALEQSMDALRTFATKLDAAEHEMRDQASLRATPPEDLREAISEFEESIRSIRTSTKGGSMNFRSMTSEHRRAIRRLEQRTASLKRKILHELRARDVE